MTEPGRNTGIDLKQVEEYLAARTGATVEVREVRLLKGETTGKEALKQFGYGQPVMVCYAVDGAEERVVFHRIRRNAFGREREDDRVAAVWLDFRTFNDLPRHAPALDLVMQTGTGAVRSIAEAEELWLVSGYRPGRPYAEDLACVRDEGRVEALDFRRAEALAAYLAGIHRTSYSDQTLWQRRLRDLIGHGEGIMGLTDNYPSGLSYAPEEELRAIEELANRWRWRLKPLDHRLRQVHGDFHPFNILFDEGLEFYVLDRSRGAWGEPADDVACLSINYLFFSLQRTGRLEAPFAELHDRFWERYLAARPDAELAAVIQPWFAWRALVLASPVWYPTLSDEVRRKLLNFAWRVLHAERYDYRAVNGYLEPV